MGDEADDPLESLVGLVAVATLPLGILASMFVGEQAAAVVFVTGWLFLVPVLAILGDEFALGERLRDRWSGTDATDSSVDAGDEPLQRLRDRYAAGEIDEPEFERRLERLLETEDLDPEAASADDLTATETSAGTARESEREREFDAE